MQAKPTLSVDGAALHCVAVAVSAAVQQIDFSGQREILLLFARAESTRPRRGSSEPPALLLLGLGRAPPPQFSISRIPDRGHPLHRSALTADCHHYTWTWGSSRVPGARNSPTNRPRPQQAAIVVIVYSSLFPITTARPPPPQRLPVWTRHTLCPFLP